MPSTILSKYRDVMGKYSTILYGQIQVSGGTCLSVLLEEKLLKTKRNEGVTLTGTDAPSAFSPRGAGGKSPPSI